MNKLPIIAACAVVCAGFAQQANDPLAEAVASAWKPIASSLMAKIDDVYRRGVDLGYTLAKHGASRDESDRIVELVVKGTNLTDAAYMVCTNRDNGTSRALYILLDLRDFPPKPPPKL